VGFGVVDSSVELIAGALVVLGLIVVAGRFLLRGESGELVLPRIVDDSIGMWVLRRLSGRSRAGGRAPGAPGPSDAAGPRPYDAAMARRLGMLRASEVVPDRRARAGAWVGPGPVVDRSGRSGPGRVMIGFLAVVAIVVGVAVGTGMAMLGPHGAAPGIAGQPASGREPHGSVSPTP
jgi:hypothetical protein